MYDPKTFPTFPTSTASTSTASTSTATRRLTLRGASPWLLGAVAVGLLACLAVGTAMALPSRGQLGDAIVLGALPGGPSPVLERLAQRLELSEDQRETLRSVVRQRGPEIVDGLEAIKNSRLELFAAIHRHPATESEVRAASAAAAEAQADFAVLRSELVDALYAELDAEQREEMAAIETDVVTLAEALATRIRDALNDRLEI